MARFFPEFEKETGIKIRVFLLSEEEYNEKLVTELSSRSGFYDVFMVGFTHIWQYAYAGWMEPLDSYIADSTLTPKEWDFEDFFPIIIEGLRWNLQPGSGIGEGNLWAIPVNEEAYVIFYRKDLFERFNVKVPETYQEVYEAAKQLTREVDGKQIYGFSSRGIPSWTTINTGYLSAFDSYGAHDFDENFNCTINNASAVEITDIFMKTLRECGPPGWPGYTWYEGKEGFLSGHFAMWFDCNHHAGAFEDPSISEIAGKIGYLLPPPGPDGKISSNAWVWSLAINAFSENKENAWKWIRWATSKGILQRTIPYENINPTRQSVWNSKETKALTNWGDGEYWETAELLLNKYAKICWTPNPKVTQVGDRWAVALQEIFTGTKTTQRALDDAERDINQIMKKSGLLKLSGSKQEKH
ncbi:sugar ABC transporter substrate-binding protein [bacterium]|nr:sugar ABC transporter substrate-binding protein [bacterium]